MEFKGYVRGFGRYTPQQLEQMKKDLEISMPISMLGFCASYFGKQEKRDPAIEELKLLDTFCNTLRKDPSAIAPIELITNDAFVAETYADMMRKRNELFPMAKAPCSVREAFQLANRYLTRAGKQATLANHLALLEVCAEPSQNAHDDSLVPSTQTNVALRHLGKSPEKESEGDQLLLLFPAPHESFADYDRLVSRFLASPTVMQRVKRICQIGENGLLYELLQLFEGVNVSLPRLSRLGEPMPLSMLVKAYQGKHLLRVSVKDAAILAKESAALGLRACHFANVLSSPRINVVQDQTRSFSWSTDFLRAIIPIRPTPVHLAAERHEADAPIHHLPIGTEGCQYLSYVPARKTEVCTNGAVLTALAASRPLCDFFRNALDTALTTVLTLAASGCHYSEQRLAISLGLPEDFSDSHSAGESISTVLGLYRLQAELGIPLITGRPEVQNGISHPQITAFAVAANGSPCPSQLQGESNRLYCIMPKLQGNGLPSFSELRNLLALLADLRNRKILQSAHVLCRESVTDALAEMRTEALSCRFTGDAWASQGKLPLAILLETSEPLEGAKQVARVTKRTLPTTKAEPALPPAQPLIQASCAKITLIARKEDPEARKLCNQLRLRGAEVTEAIITMDTSNDLLAKSIFAAQTLIVCRGVDLPDSKQVAFAIDTVTRGGGRILFPGRENADLRFGGIALADGLSEKMLEQICTLQK